MTMTSIYNLSRFFFIFLDPFTAALPSLMLEIPRDEI